MDHATTVQGPERLAQLAHQRLHIGRRGLTARHPFTQGHYGRHPGNLIAPGTLLVRLDQPNQAGLMQILQQRPGAAAAFGAIPDWNHPQNHILKFAGIDGFETPARSARD